MRRSKKKKKISLWFCDFSDTYSLVCKEIVKL